jgi:CRP-like cAMP-binding protein
MSDSLDLAIATIPYFRGLRPDERTRVADLMTRVILEPAEERPLGADGAVVLVVLSGEVKLTRGGVGELLLDEGDWTDELRAVAGQGRLGTLIAQSPARLAQLDKSALDQLFEQMPVIAVPLLAELGREASRRNDLMRDVALARTSGLPPTAFKALVTRRRRQMLRHRHVSAARIGSLLFRALVAEPSRRLTFWMFLGATLALVSARTVVAMIIHNGLQSRLFALIGGGEAGHPIHVHHFNYGLIIVALVGLLSFMPRIRRALRTLSFAFGFGVGLVVDEFALLWNLNPDYYQPESRLAAAVVLFGLVQVVFFRSLYLAVARRLVAWIHP